MVDSFAHEANTPDMLLRGIETHSPGLSVPGGAARKLDQPAARKVIHRKDVHSTFFALSVLFPVRGQGCDRPFFRPSTALATDARG
jgi:hypothetical protein